ncbi:hypothetical protein LTR85_003740 [Meristemomyces frigidus]|nr:hypothetical protein LTR85_003740 [Meristemomyces frigidus]
MQPVNDIPDFDDSIPTVVYEAEGGLAKLATTSKPCNDVNYYTSTYKSTTCQTDGQCVTITTVLTGSKGAYLTEALSVAGTGTAITAPTGLIGSLTGPMVGTSPKTLSMAGTGSGIVAPSGLIGSVTGPMVGTLLKATSIAGTRTGTAAPSGLAGAGTAPIISTSPKVTPTTTRASIAMTTLPIWGTVPLYTIDCLPGATVRTWTTTSIFGGPAVIECATSTTVTTSSSASPEVTLTTSPVTIAATTLSNGLTVPLFPKDYGPGLTVRTWTSTLPFGCTAIIECAPSTTAMTSSTSQELITLTTQSSTALVIPLPVSSTPVSSTPVSSIPVSTIPVVSSPTVDCAMLSLPSGSWTTTYPLVAMLILECLETPHPTPIMVPGAYQIGQPMPPTISGTSQTSGIAARATSVSDPLAGLLPTYTVDCGEVAHTSPTWTTTSMWGGEAVLQCASSTTTPAPTLPPASTSALPASITITCPGPGQPGVNECWDDVISYFMALSTDPSAAKRSLGSMASATAIVPSSVPNDVGSKGARRAREIGGKLPHVPRETVAPIKTGFITSVVNKPRESVCDEIPIIDGMGLCTLLDYGKGVNSCTCTWDAMAAAPTPTTICNTHVACPNQITSIRMEETRTARAGHTRKTSATQSVPARREIITTLGPDAATATNKPRDTADDCSDEVPILDGMGYCTMWE